MGRRAIRTRSLAFKLARYQLIAITTGLVALFSVIGYRNFQSMHQDLSRDIERTITEQQHTFTQLLWNLNIEGTEKLLRELSHGENILYAEVVGPNGQQLASSGKDVRSVGDEALRAARNLVHRSGTTDHELGKLIIQFHDAQLWKRIYDGLAQDVLIFLIVSLVTLTSAHLVTKRIIGRPLERLSFSIRKIQTEGVNVTVDWKSEDELGEVVAAYNEMVAQLLEATGQARMREEHLSGIMRNAADGIFTTDAQGNVETFNPAAEEIFRYREEQVLGNNVNMFIPPADRTLPGGSSAIDPIIGQRWGAVAREITALRGDGSTFPMSLIVSAMTVGGAPKFIGIVRDITGQKELDQQLRQAQKMDAIGQLTGGVAHDFNNLLMIIIGNLQLAEEDISGSGEAPKQLKTALNAALRGAELTKRLLAFSRKEMLFPALTDMNALVPNTIGLLERTLGEHIEIETVLADEVWPVMIDQGLLENALINLGVNSRDAMPGGGKLTIETANVRLDRSYAHAHGDVTPGQYVMVAISDSGTGMSPEILSHAFEPFFTTKDVGQGTGLGLSMVYGFAKQSGGHAAIYSEEGSGTTIRLYFPKSNAQPDTPSEPRTEAAEYPCGGETILVVEDDPDVRSYVVASLTLLGYAVLEARDGPAAIKILKSGSPIGLLLTDVVMPGGLSGLDVAEAAREIQPDIRVLYTSGYTEKTIADRGRLIGPADVLSKPYGRLVLAQRVRQALDNGDSGS